MRPPLPEPLARALATAARGLRARLGERLVEVRLYGSWARGEMRPESDVDVLVVVRGLCWADRVTVSEVLGSLCQETRLPLAGLPIDQGQLEFLRQRERRFAVEIDRDGIRL
jgi:predicted nucleotidyltransferase